ncbi:DUF6909 family protein [Flammeovirga kamogawensis]|uniref:Uncharacterized protein n=1 Tax=Flammeovirga kamogawensis TaxID=373891 RepID=A0ABX8GV44_9BACT|nr:hypothetical protein [Flammeovirga kamogawensis]MBB6459748.1 hypothetical protein [Flammeovirga kamogawensis]QWG07193.1 hypothetical protein KM029_18105 [Flammeovirga kamogawensis]TRX69013.1 hypothetical protein EO216_13095 [Flammeovirga kamogawensis]
MGELTRAQASRAAIERMYVVMRHLFIRGYYKPGGASGNAIMQDLLILQPEIYGTLADTQKVDLNGLVYVFDRLPKGIEETRFIKLTSEEGYEKSSFKKIIPHARRRNCYRIDEEQMFIEITRGRSEIYDILTHLTFIYIEAKKIKDHAKDDKGRSLREWLQLEEIVTGKVALTKENEEVAFTYLATLLGRTYDETRSAHHRFLQNNDKNNGLFHIVYWLGKLAMDEQFEDNARVISFSPTLRERIGHHMYGDRWADKIKRVLAHNGLIHRPIHIISSNLHSVMNSFFALDALGKKTTKVDFSTIMEEVSQSENGHLRDKISNNAMEKGMIQINEDSGTNISVQLFDMAKIPTSYLPKEVKFEKLKNPDNAPVIIVMDYAFGEQAFETMDELLKPFTDGDNKIELDVRSVSIMGKAGILKGGKGDIMIPSAHIFEGTADNYPVNNDLKVEDFADLKEIKSVGGPMITVLGTSLQNKDILKYFKDSSWGVMGLEMEGAHYQKAIQGASKIRNNISADVKVRYAYYASDNPLITGSTLANGSLGLTGVRPTYAITLKILEKILGDHK